MSIRDWPEGERPREKLLALGAEQLSDAELLAVFLRTGVAGASAVDLARELIARFNGLRGLLAADRASALATAKPMRPEERLVSTRTGSTASRVGPAVMTAWRPASGPLPAPSSRPTASTIAAGSLIRPSPTSPQA